jgi:predicted RNA-binding protein
VCESTVFVEKDMKYEEIMCEVEFIEEKGGLLKIIDIMGKEVIINGRITKVDLVKNQIFISK